MDFKEKTLKSNLVFDGKVIKVYNDEVILELFMKNNNFSCLVLIDENESFDIDFTSK